ncbi:MAG: F0F1 ATP synthase subunit B, partial [bacterium]
TSEGSVDEGLLASLGLNGQLFISQWINFAIVVAILWFLILKPLVKKLNERQKMIDDSISNAEKIQKNLDRSEKDYLAKMDVAKAEACRILTQANSEAEVVAEQVKEKAKNEIEAVVLQAKKNIGLEKDEMVSKLKQQTADMIVLALEKILSEKIDGKKDKELIEKAIKDMK